MTNDKIRSTHLTRRAVVYLRQSSLHQVRTHRESTKRQYALRERAIELGWSADSVETVDEDLGVSAKLPEQRMGFERLAEGVAQGRVGALFALEVSRLARSSSDWYRLLDLAGLANVLIADESSVYDPRDPNDRLLLGLKGQFADAELYWMRLRLHGGKLSKARRGEVVFNPPTGYVWGSNGSNRKLQIDPDENVQRAIRLIFERFRIDECGSGVVRYFKRHGLQMPVRDSRTGDLKWTLPRYRFVWQLLRNPLYAGAYVFGRREGRTTLANGRARRSIVDLPLEQWKVCIRDAHPGYITWEDFLANRRKLADNFVGRPKGEPESRGAPREGNALLQGLVICGRCGMRMRASYSARGPQRREFYVCIGGKFKGDGDGCWAVSTRNIDPAIEAAFLSVVQPGEIDLSLAVARDAEHQASEIERQWNLRLETARYEVRLCERRYKAVDPDNRTVARSLERDWNDKLEELARLEEEFEEVRRREKVILTARDRHAVLALSKDLPRVWNARSTTVVDKKNLLRMLIQHVSLSPVDVPTRQTRVRILWVTGATTEVAVPRPTSAQASGVTSDQVREAVRRLFDEGLSDAQIAARLNASKMLPPRAADWTSETVRRTRSLLRLLRENHPKRRTELRRDDGLYSTAGVAKLLRIPPERVHVWRAQGHIKPSEGGSGRPLWYRLDAREVERLRQLRRSRVKRGYRVKGSSPPD
jgi:DNA invertase Pin-like site-specific DNA recombinase